MIIRIKFIEKESESVKLDEKYKGSSITAKLYTTSLNSHFAGI